MSNIALCCSSLLPSHRSSGLDWANGKRSLFCRCLTLLLSADPQGIWGVRGDLGFFFLCVCAAEHRYESILYSRWAIAVVGDCRDLLFLEMDRGGESQRIGGFCSTDL